MFLVDNLKVAVVVFPSSIVLARGWGSLYQVSTVKVSAWSIDREKRVSYQRYRVYQITRVKQEVGKSQCCVNSWVEIKIVLFPTNSSASKLNYKHIVIVI